MRWLEFCNEQLENLRSRVLKGVFWTWVSVRKHVLKLVDLEIDLHAIAGEEVDNGGCGGKVWGWGELVL